MRRSPRRGTSSSSSASLHKYDLYNINASNARALLTCYTKAKPRPSKWDDAQKWLSRAPDDGHGRRRSSGADDRLLLPPASHEGISRPSWTWSNVLAADADALDEGETKRVVDPEPVPVSREFLSRESVQRPKEGSSRNSSLNQNGVLLGYGGEENGASAGEGETGKLAAAQAVAKEKRARAEAKLGRRAVRVVGGAGGLPSKLKLLSLKLPLLCS